MTLRARPTGRRRLRAAALGILMSGCSFASVQRARPPAAIEDPRVLDTCTTGSRAAVADTVLGAAALVVGYGRLILARMFHCADAQAGCEPGSPLPGLALMGAGGVLAGSAVYGYASTAQCRRRVVVGERCASGDPGACRRLKPGWEAPPGWRAGPTLDPRPMPAAATPCAPCAPERAQEPAGAGSPSRP